MTKVRIYELAKELGVENKVIIARAAEIGLTGKASHSSSLESHEADQIRRSIIRDTMGGDGRDAAPERAAEQERLTTRVDKITGETQAIVESRKGNVIRRRKQTEDAPQPVAVKPPVEEAIEEPAAPAAEIAVPEEVQTAAPEAAQPEPAEEKEAETPPPAEPPVVEEAATAQVSEADTSPAALNGSTAAAEAEPAAPGAPETEAPAVSKKPAIGPRVLGKIELPVARKPAAPAARPDGGRPDSVRGGRTGTDGRRSVAEEEEDARRAKASPKKGRKREISRVDLIDYDGRESRRAGPRTGRGGRKPHDQIDAEREKQLEATKMKASKRVVEVNEAITVGELARQMSLKSGEVIAKLMQLGMMATINQSLDIETATIVAEEFGYQVQSTSFDEAKILQTEAVDDPESLKVRAPVVTVMGHVDHGKTSLLDAIRESSVAAREAGGITQHIGAYQVDVPEKGKVTFIDTPGHAAFTSMRARGAQVTDIVVLVVAADDGVMPQTVEAINHAKAAKVPIIVAVNKVDKPDAQPDRIRQQLVEHGLQPEDWGGDTMFFNVSALKKQGISELLEGLLLVAELRELRANPERRAQGTIIETKQDKGRGTVATVLVQNGTLKMGDIFVAGAEFGRIRSMNDANGERVTEAGPSTPVEITGLSGMPEAGDDFFVVEAEANAREVSDQRKQKLLQKEQRLAAGPISLEEFARRANNLAGAELNVILKTDVHGSLEAVREAVEKLTTPKVKVRVLHAAVGGINESDVQLAAASQAIVIGFGVRAEPRALQVAESISVELRFYRIIYELLDDVKQAMAGLLAPVRQEIRTGRVEVRETFNIPKAGTVAGCYVVDGVIRRGSFVRLLRDSRVVHEGKMASLKRFKDDVREVQSGYECGIMLESFNDVKTGDVVEVFEVKEVAASID